MTVRVLGLASGVTSLEDHRHAIAALITPAGVMQRRGGLFPGDGGDLVTVSAMTAKVTAFYSWIDGGSAALQAGYDFTSDADEVLAFADGEAAVARIDRVIARVRHHTYDASGSTLGDVVVLKGQASGAATALPPSCELLWEVTVPATASAGTGGINFTTQRVDKRRWTVAAGGGLPVRNQAERDAVVAPYAGMKIWRIDRAWAETHDGVAWRVQGVGTVASAADRSAVTNPYSGQIIMRTDKGWLERWNGANWRPVSPAAVTDAADLTASFPGPTDGDQAYQRDAHAPAFYHGGMGAWVHGAVPIASTRVSVDISAVTFSSIPQVFKHLLIVAQGRTADVAGYVDVGVRFNFDAGNNYSSHAIYAQDSGAPAAAPINGASSGVLGLLFAGASAAAGEAAGGSLLVPNYSSTDWKKQGFGTSTYNGAAISLTSPRGVGWASTAAINAVTLLSRNGGNVKVGTRVDIYGVG